MTTGKLLGEREAAIADRWLGGILRAYPGGSGDAFGPARDPFANPVGHALREGTRAIVKALVAGEDPEAIRPHVEEIVRIRAVQDLAPSAAVSFVFSLKDAIRAELGGAIAEPGASAYLADIERRIDGVALLAFDSYARCRERIADLRVNEAHRQVSARLLASGRFAAPPGETDPGGREACA